MGKNSPRNMWIKLLKPKRYKLIGSGNTHYGLIAQDIEETINKLGIKFGGLSNEGPGKMGLIYTDFIAPLVKAIQELDKKMDTILSMINKK